MLLNYSVKNNKKGFIHRIIYTWSEKKSTAGRFLRMNKDFYLISSESCYICLTIGKKVEGMGENRQDYVKSETTAKTFTKTIPAAGSGHAAASGAPFIAGTADKAGDRGESRTGDGRRKSVG